jgi:hypothetical protein
VTDETYVVVDDSGRPVGVADLRKLADEGVYLAAEMAVACEDQARLDEITARAVEKYDDATYSFVISAALRSMTQDILMPALKVAEKASGRDLRTGLHTILAGRNPQ